MDRDAVSDWIDRYEQLWRTPGTGRLGELFTDDATYLAGPWERPVRGSAALATFWDAEREGPDEGFTMERELVAVDGDTAVARLQVDYANGDVWRDLWIMRFAADGRCEAFEEWPIEPPRGH